MSEKRKTRRFRLVIEGQEMVVEYAAEYFAGLAHFEFRSPHDPARRIPVSATGYRSHFAPMAEVKAAKSVAEYARLAALEIMETKAKKPLSQLSLDLYS